MAELWVARVPGRVPYLEAVELQTRLRERRQAGEIPDSLLLLEHPPTYTKGRRSERADLPMGEEWYWSQGIEVHETSRGGRVTYHGPGQLVGYPIMGVTDVVAFLRDCAGIPHLRLLPYTQVVPILVRYLRLYAGGFKPSRCECYTVAYKIRGQLNGAKRAGTANARLIGLR